MANKKRKAGPLQKRARRDVRLSVDPVLDEIARQQSQAERDYNENVGRLGNIYGGLREDLKPLGSQYQSQVQDISHDFNKSLGGLANLLAPSLEAYRGLSPEDAAGAQQQFTSQVAPENSAAVGMFGTVGATGQEMLASDRSRNAAYQTSSMRQVGLQQHDYERQYLQDYRDTIDDLQASRQDLINATPQQILARLDQLREQRRQNRLANAELQLRKEIADKQAHQQGKAYNAAQDVVNKHMNANQLGNKIHNLNQNVLPGLTSRIHDLKDDYPGTTKTGGKWGYNSPQGDFVPLPQLNKLTQQRRRKRKRVKTLTKRKRNL